LNASGDGTEDLLNVAVRDGSPLPFHHFHGWGFSHYRTGIVANPALHLCIKAAIILISFPVSLIAEQCVKGSGAVVYCILIPLYIVVFVNNMFVILPGLPV
jgi:hypothetical protein